MYLLMHEYIHTATDMYVVQASALRNLITTEKERGSAAQRGNEGKKREYSYVKCFLREKMEKLCPRC